MRAPVAAPAIEMGTIRVLVLPWADVFIDGVIRGRSPLSVQVPVGEHAVRITGGVEHQEHVMVTAGQTPLISIDGEAQQHD